MRATHGAYVNPRRIQALMYAAGTRHIKAHHRLLLDGGQEIHLDERQARRLAESLGLPSPTELDPDDPVSRTLYAEGLRDWPFDLSATPGTALRRHFGRDERRLIANVVWQAVREHRPGGAHTAASGTVRWWGSWRGQA